MTITVGTSGGNKVVSALYVGTTGGNKAVLNAYVGTAGGNKLFYSSLAVTASPSVVTGTTTSPTPVTNSTTATATGGLAPNYAWVYLSGDAAIIINSPTSATTAFQKTMALATFTTGGFVCTVTDSNGQTAVSNAVWAELERI